MYMKTKDKVRMSMSQEWGANGQPHASGRQPERVGLLLDFSTPQLLDYKTVRTNRECL